MAEIVAGKQYYDLDGQLSEIKRQLRQPGGYPFDLELLKRHLQDAIEGRFVLGDPKLILIKPFELANFLGEGWTTWKGPADGDGLSGEEDIDPRSLAFSEIEVVKFLFETCLREGESRVSGEEKLRRLRGKTDFIRFGGNVFLGLWLDYEANRKDSILEFLYKTQKVRYMAFFGTILRSPGGDRSVLFLYRSVDGHWYWNYYWLVNGWGAGGPSVGCASSSLIFKS